MSPAEAIAMETLNDLAGIAKRNTSIMSRYQAMEDRLFRAARDLEAAPKPDCDCGEAGCARGVCSGPEAA